MNNKKSIGGTNQLNKVEKVVMVACAFIIATVCVTPLPKLGVEFIENFIIHRPSVDVSWLIRDIRQQCCYLVGLFLFSFLFFRKGKYQQFFAGFSIYTFMVSTINVVLTPEYQGYRSLWDYSDFVVSVNTGYGNLYGTNYPPLAILIFKLLHVSIDPLPLEQRTYYINHVVFLFLMINALFLFAQFSMMYNENGKFDMKRSMIFSGIIFVTGPILFVFQRGNVALFALIFLGAFLLLKDSSNEKKRRTSSLMVALAANMKFYPIVYGLMYIKEKKWKEAIWATVYSVFLFSFMLPFRNSTLKVFAAESNFRANVGINNQKSAIGNILGQVKILVDFVQDDTGGVSVKGIVDTFYSLMGRSNTTILYSVLVIVATVIVAILCIWAFFKTQRKDLELAMLAFLCIMIPPVSAWYSLSFLVFPLIIIIRDVNKENVTVFKKIEILLYVITFAYAEFRGLYVGPGYNWYFILLVIVSLIDAFCGDRFVKKGLSV